ncbi:hypothetical protein [uncultured Ruegeria sp.]|uniref:hypothetical protein n=1 Tax=uncultured Ruegeria sp. TaxID=259304 RepID=UPI00260D4AB1|nr:hypothetical protein [uncultured Ruegeria sp.]
MDAKLKRTTLRLPQALYDRIEAAAVGKLSMNALIIETLEKAFPPPVDPDEAALISALIDRLNSMEPEKANKLLDGLEDTMKDPDGSLAGPASLLLAILRGVASSKSDDEAQPGQHNIDAEGVSRPGVRKVDLDD